MLHSQGHKTESNNNNTGEAARQRKLQADCPLVYSENSHLKKKQRLLFHVCPFKQRLTLRCIWAVLSNVETTRKAAASQPAHRQTAWWWRFVYTELAGLASPLPRAAESKKKPRNSLTELLGILTAHHIYRAAFHHTERGIQTLPSASTAESTTVRPRWPADYGSPCCFDSHN